MQYNKLLYQAMRKYGLDNFTFDILIGYPTSDWALEREDDWIEIHQSRSSQNGYNCALGGAGPGPEKSKERKKVYHTKESRKKMSESMTIAHENRRVLFIDTLKELHAKGLSNAEIRQETGLAASTIRKWLRMLGLKSNNFKRSPLEALPEIRELALSGKTAKEIGLIVKCKSDTVRRLLRENGLPINRHRMGPLPGKVNSTFEAKKAAAIPVILELRRQGKTKREIRSHVKMGAAFVGQVLRNHGMSKL